MHHGHSPRLKESALLQNLLSHHHSKIINSSCGEEGLQSPRCRPAQPLFRSTTFLLNLNMSFTTYTRIVRLLNNIQRIAHQHTLTTHQPYAMKPAKPHGVRAPAAHSPPNRPESPRIAPPNHPCAVHVSPCECLHSHTGYFRPVNYPVKTKGSKQTSRHPAPTLAPTRAHTGAGINTPEGTLHPTNSALAQACWRIHSRCERTPTWQRTSSGQKPTSAP